MLVPVAKLIWLTLLATADQVPSVQEEAVEEPAEPAVAEPEAGGHATTSKRACL